MRKELEEERAARCGPPSQHDASSTCQHQPQATRPPNPCEDAQPPESSKPLPTEDKRVERESSPGEEGGARILSEAEGGSFRANFPQTENTCITSASEAGRLPTRSGRATRDVGTFTSQLSLNPRGDSHDGPQRALHAEVEIQLPAGTAEPGGHDRTRSTTMTSSHEIKGATLHNPTVGDVAVQTSVHINPTFDATAEAASCAEPSCRDDGSPGDWPQHVAAWPNEAMAGTVTTLPPPDDARADDARVKRSQEWPGPVSGVDGMRWGNSPIPSRAGAGLQDTGATRVGPLRAALQVKADPAPRGSGVSPEDINCGTLWAGATDEDVCRCAYFLTRPDLVPKAC